MHTTLSIDAVAGLLVGVRQVLSPHTDERPAGVKPSPPGSTSSRKGILSKPTAPAWSLDM